ncbi:uncharacterized protein SPPG_01725 [Spizellomyces punctatus DAOM BR117]|uniref:FAD dependent oxidoreductase domain-containing protein n=1 Tax=Spizellomyces punctatus (strain DAOM BR117) TaxID=645134 RepID=A0A0L0HNI5_SPIPD|nr:uncharacterized protein SPPG_01725 [Spizellomyces punctatus DAOM BR117]KND02637.1 hypothetical protein SPPG_01725 [Spizellomyces punctatus DAOM BR117]|eukprot:XP_016610676.1 hypothetical protein SPPG_01725 [Spizellomyces punctatus DAOM BR117]
MLVKEDEETSHIAIIGSGIFGLSAALELRLRGYRVTIFDRHTIPVQDAASTDISKIVRPDHGNDILYQNLAIAAVNRWKDWSEECYRQTGKEIFVQSGAVFLSSNSPLCENSFEADSVAALRKAGYEDEVEVFSDSGVAEKYQGFKDVTRNFPGGYLSKMAGYVDASLAVEYVAELAKTAGVQFVTGDAGRVEAIMTKDSIRSCSVMGIRTSDQTFHACSHLLVAAGPRSISLLPGLKKVMVATGQPVIHLSVPEHLQLKYSASNFPVWAAEVPRTGFYGFPLKDGVLKVANHGPGYIRHEGTAMPSTLDMDIPKGAVSGFRSFLAQNFPELNSFNILRTRLCWYTDTFDSDFFITPYPGHEGLFLATGGSGHAFKFFPVLGPIIADVVEGKPESDSRYPDAIQRFKWREPMEEGQGLESHPRLSGSQKLEDCPLADTEDLKAIL